MDTVSINDQAAIKRFKAIWDRSVCLNQVATRTKWTKEKCSATATRLRHQGVVLQTFSSNGNGNNRPTYYPTPEEIELAKKQIQKNWTEHELQARLRPDWRSSCEIREIRTV